MWKAWTCQQSRSTGLRFFSSFSANSIIKLGQIWDSIDWHWNWSFYKIPFFQLPFQELLVWRWTWSAQSLIRDSILVIRWRPSFLFVYLRDIKWPRRIYSKYCLYTGKANTRTPASSDILNSWDNSCHCWLSIKGTKAPECFPRSLGWASLGPQIP
jgi:hypothetical protein